MSYETTEFTQEEIDKMNMDYKKTCDRFPNIRKIDAFSGLRKTIETDEKFAKTRKKPRTRKQRQNLLPSPRGPPGLPPDPTAGAVPRPPPLPR